MDIPINEDNFEPILKKLLPRIALQKYAARKRFTLDLQEIESIYWSSLLGAIRRWEEGRGNCKFENFFWHHAECNLMNASMKEVRKRNPFVVREIEYEPCTVCKSRNECEEKDDCAKLNRFKKKQVGIYYLQQFQVEPNMLDNMIRIDVGKNIIKSIYARRPQYRRILSDVLKLLNKGIAPHKAMRAAILITSMREGKREQTIYNKIKRLGNLVKEIQKEMVEETGKGLYNISIEEQVRRFSMKLICVKCGAKKGVTKDRLAKLIQKNGNEEQLKKVYTCRGCKSSKVSTAPITPPIEEDPQEDDD